MVPNLSKGRGIKGTALYVLHDVRDEAQRDTAPDRQSADRVGHIATRNLSTDNPDLAWRLMCQTAAAREQLKAAAGVHKGGRPHKFECGHLSLSWEHQTRPDAAEIERAAEGALKAIGWDKLQALIVEHRDHQHAHCHIVVNLIDPDTGRCAPNSKGDFDKLQRWAHDYDQARGLTVCERRAERIEAEARTKGQGRPRGARHKWLPRQEWEAQRAATQDAEQRTQQGASRAAALAQIKASAAEQRAAFRSEWGDLYKRQRQELRQLDQRERDQARKMKWAIDKPAARAAMLRELQPAMPAPAPAPAPAPKPKGLMGAAVSPDHLARTIDKARQVERLRIEQRHAAEKASLAAKVEAARHEAHREIWRQHGERVDATRTPDPVPQRPTTAAERELAQYAEQRRARSAAREIRRIEDPGGRVEPHSPGARPSQAASPSPATPANTNDRDQRYQDFVARFAAQRRREREVDRHLGRERER